MKKITKAIIPAAGLGTRFLPATKAMPKEMLPILGKPTIQYIVEEAVQSGIEDIIIVTGKGKRAIEDHFDYAGELERNLKEKGKFELLAEVRKSSNLGNIHYIRQKEPRGLGHAIWCARKFIGDESFAVLLGDDIVVSKKPCLQQLIEQFEELDASVIAIQEVLDEETHRYGVIDAIQLDECSYKVNHLIEKPPSGTAPSNLAIIGRYVFKPEIFRFLEEMKIGAGGEIQLTDAIQQLNRLQNVYAYSFEGERYDVGENLGFIKATLEFALKNDHLREDVWRHLVQIIEKQEW